MKNFVVIMCTKFNKSVDTIIKVGWEGGLVLMARKERENFLPYYIQNLKICIKTSILLLNIAMFVHFLAMQLHNPTF